MQCEQVLIYMGNELADNTRLATLDLTAESHIFLVHAPTGGGPIINVHTIDEREAQIQTTDETDTVYDLKLLIQDSFTYPPQEQVEHKIEHHS